MIKWHGMTGSPGLAPNVQVRVKFRNCTEDTAPAGTWVWNHVDDPYDIIGYEVVEEDRGHYVGLDRAEPGADAMAYMFVDARNGSRRFSPVPLPPIGESQRRKNQPIFRGCLDYFPDALLAVAELSRIANEKHNPGEPLHWSKDKSSDHADCCVRHLMERGKWDTSMAEPVRHSTAAAWRALANLQTEIELEREGKCTKQST